MFELFQKFLLEIWGERVLILLLAVRDLFLSHVTHPLHYCYPTNHLERQRGWVVKVTDSGARQLGWKYQRCHLQMLCELGHVSYLL